MDSTTSFGSRATIVKSTSTVGFLKNINNDLNESEDAREFDTYVSTHVGSVCRTLSSSAHTVGVAAAIACLFYVTLQSIHAQ